MIRIFTTNSSPNEWYFLLPKDLFESSFNAERLCMQARALVKRLVFWCVDSSLLKKTSVEAFRIQQASVNAIATFFAEGDPIP